jgi:hypothetical protein
MPATISFYKRSTDLRVLLLICLLVIGGVAASAKAWSRFYSPVPINVATSPSFPAINLTNGLIPQSNSLPRELITIRPTGFEPAEISRPPGRFLLAINNKSGLDEVVLRIQREGGSRQHEVRIRQENFRWRVAATLSSGRYILTAPEHPDWRCIIIITQ